MIFAARQLQEKCQEQHSDLFVTFIDLTKAFDTVSRDGLWKIMGKFGCPSKIITIVRQFHDGMLVKVLDDGDESEAFPVTNGVKQGCVLAPTLFSTVFSVMLIDAFRDCQDGMHVRYRTDGGLFNLRCLQDVTKVKETVIKDFLFADDCALNADTEQKMQHEMDCFSRACDNFGLIINTKNEPTPGHTLSRAVNIDAEVINRIAKASSAFGRLRENVWERRGLSLSTKLKVYRAVVLTTLLYACETWTVYSRHAKQLNRFHLSCLRRLLCIKWQDKIPDTEVLEPAGILSIHTLLQKAQVRWAEHVVRMADSRLPKQLLYGELCEDKRLVGGQKKRFKDSLKAFLKDININVSTWKQLATNHSTWRSKVSTGACAAEKRRTTEAQKKRAASKARAAYTSKAAPTHTCPVCGRALGPGSASSVISGPTATDHRSNMDEPPDLTPFCLPQQHQIRAQNPVMLRLPSIRLRQVTLKTKGCQLRESSRRLAMRKRCPG
ncbi:uncharacterized protein LOC119579712 [Penaeus monodon]|uniref:uncharacterized protein LOC119579712 n=1 Tax=Penaeus monodon TaxID=6687 RepID=UPI0018A724B7|nr:uncharacterized protein LOC119579712 [Penaeus monodon]